MFFSKKYKESLLKIERIAVRIHECVHEIKEQLAVIIGLLKTPTTHNDVFIIARFGGMAIKFKLGDEITFMFTVADDHKDEPFSIDPITGAKDAEGNDIPASDFTITDVVSDNEAAVSIVDDPNNPDGKAFHFGAPGLAHAGCDIKYNGEVVKHLEAAFTVTTGVLDPNSIVGGSLDVPGLTADA